MKKCIECGVPHKNKGKESDYKEIGDRCFNCNCLVEMLEDFVESINNQVPIMGKPRKLTILGYKIEKT